MDYINVIFSCQEKFEEMCLNELNTSNIDFQFIRWFEHGLGIASTESFEVFSSYVQRKGFIFLRHIFPVEYTVNYLSDDETLQGTYSEIACGFSKRMIGKTFSVQMRKKNPGINVSSFVRTVISHFEKAGYTYDAKNPDYIISGYVDEQRLYIGFSTPRLNLSPWAGGMCRYSFRPDTISRAEFKLLETIDYFSLDLSTCKSGVDLGASPGGWTKILVQNGIHVVAVDPAELAPQLQQHPKVTHYRDTAQNFLQDNKQQFDILLNDMKMDVPISVKIMNEMANVLRHHGYAIMTFKLTNKKIMRTINNGLDLLTNQYDILHVKQLFHNRMEITVVCRRR